MIVALTYISDNNDNVSDSFKYALKISSVEIRFFKSIILLITLIARLRHSSVKIFRSSIYIILYT